MLCASVSRRHLFAGAAALALAACTAAQLSAGLTQAAQDAGTIAAGLKGILPQIGTIAGISPATVSKVGAAIADVQTVAAALVGASSASAALPTVQRLETDLNTIVSALAGLPLPPPIGTVLQAASVLLPVIEAGVGMVVAAVNAPSAGAGITPDQARAVLKAAAGG